MQSNEISFYVFKSGEVEINDGGLIFNRDDFNDFDSVIFINELDDFVRLSADSNKKFLSFDHIILHIVLASIVICYITFLKTIT